MKIYKGTNNDKYTCMCTQYTCISHHYITTVGWSKRWIYEDLCVVMKLSTSEWKMTKHRWFHMHTQYMIRLYTWNIIITINKIVSYAYRMAIHEFLPQNQIQKICSIMKTHINNNHYYKCSIITEWMNEWSKTTAQMCELNDHLPGQLSHQPS